MRIQARDRRWILQELMQTFATKLLDTGYAEGPGFQRFDSGEARNFTFAGQIISVQMKESEVNECCLIVESEKEIPELYDVWDASLIELGNKIMKQLVTFATNKEKVQQGIR